MAQSKSSSNQRILGLAAIAIAGIYACYGLYSTYSSRYLSSRIEETGEENSDLVSVVNGKVYVLKSPKSVSFILTKSLLDQGFPLRSITIGMPHAIIILHPDLDKEKIIAQYGIREEEERVLLSTTKEESCFHLMKLVASQWNFVNLRDFAMTFREVSDMHMERFVRNFTDLSSHDENMVAEMLDSILAS